MCALILAHRNWERYPLGMDLPIFEPHSAAPKDEWEGTSPTGTNTVLQFAEGLPGMTSGYARAKDETFGMTDHPEIGIQDMLSRPQRILSLNWDIGDTINITTVSVLKLLLSDKRVVNRINNLSYLNATVNIRVVVSGTPQHYGMVVCALNPWYRTDDTNVQIGGNNGPTQNQLVQLPHLMADVSTSVGGELSLPLMTPFNMIELQSVNQVEDIMGFHIMSFGPLQSVSPISTSATINVWAWLSDVVITTPTAIGLPYLVAQSGDEYGTPTISKMASVGAKWTDYFSRIPVIGPYAMASTMFLDTTSKIAELFGFSRPCALKTEAPMQHKPVSNLVHYNCEDTSTKLTLDAKAEVTIDPSISGVQLNDEMAIANLVSREGYIGAFTWSTADGTGKILARATVTPTLARTITSTGILPHENNIYDFTPLAFTSLAFSRWRGTIRFRFLVVCSHFHKGRIRFVYEPGAYLNVGGTPSWNNETNVNQSYIMDLASSRELTIEVPWATARSYLKVTAPLPTQLPFYDFSEGQLETLQNDRSAFNGLIGAHVLVPLTAPSSEQSIRILCFVSAAPDFELQKPGNSFANYVFSGWVAQSGPEDLGAGVLTGNQMFADRHSNLADILETKELSYSDKLAMIHFGERIVSIRQLIKRYVHHSHIKFPGSQSQFQIYSYNTSNFPSYKGYSANALTKDTSGDRFNYARDSYLSYFALAFLGFRGSIRQKYHLNLHDKFCFHMAVSNSETSSQESIIAFGTSRSNVANLINTEYDTRLGSSVTEPELNNVIEVETPHYSHNRFFMAQKRNKFLDEDEPGIDYERHKVTITGYFVDDPTYLTRYVAAGDDFQYVFFKYAPCGKAMNSPAASVTE